MAGRKSMNDKLSVLAMILFTTVSIAEAQQTAKVAKIGWLTPGSVPTTRIELFLREFRKLGYVEGKNIAIETRYAEDKLDRLPGLADELVRLKVDVLLTPGGNGALALRKATKTIPIVFFGAVSDPVAAGLVDSLARPGGNVTGFTTISAVLVGKRLELLKESVPNLSRVAVLWNPKGQGAEQAWKDSQLAARELGLQLHSMEVSSADKYAGVFKQETNARSTALAVTQHTLASSNQKRITDLATKNRLPAMYYRGDFVASGGLMSYGADQDEPYRRAASMVDK